MGDSLPSWLLTVSTVLEEVAMADLFRTIALDVMDVSRTELDVVDSKLEGEEDRKKKLLLVMMPLQMMLMVHQLKNMVLLLLMRHLVTMRTMTTEVVPLMILTVPQLRNMVLLPMMLMVLPLKNTALLLMMLTPLLKDPPTM